MKKSLTSPKLWLLINIIITIVLVNLTFLHSPQEIGPPGVLFWFGTLYLWLLSLSALITCWLKKENIISKLQLLNYSIRILLIVAFLALQSLGQLQPRDTALLISLALLITVYLGRLKAV